jgi:hypothetical protein
VSSRRLSRDFAARYNIDTAEGGGVTPGPTTRAGAGGVDIGVINGRTYAFVSLERAGGVMIYESPTPPTRRLSGTILRPRAKAMRPK